MTDAELLARFRRGDTSAFGDLFQRHTERLHRVAYALLANQADAEDAVQETFAGAFKSARSFRGDASVATWLMRILVKQAALLRRRRRWKFWSFDRLASEPAADANEEVDSREDVIAMLQTLSDEHRQVIVLRELQQMSYAEIAEALSIPPGTVESRLHRARSELKKRFERYA